MIPSVAGRAPEILYAQQKAIEAGAPIECDQRKERELTSMSDAALVQLWQACKFAPIPFDRQQMIQRLLAADVQLMRDYSPEVMRPKE